MKNKIQALVAHPLISGSTIIFLGTNIANVLNYLFNIVLARSLSIHEYGILASMLSIMNILFVFSSTITSVFTKFTASFKAQEKEYMITYLIKKGIFWINSCGICICLLFLLSTSEVSKFLHIENSQLLHIVFITIFISFISAIPLGSMQGLLQFTPYSLIVIFTSLTKLLVGLLFILLQFKVVGVLFSFLVASSIGYVLSMFSIKKYLFISIRDITLPIQKINKKIFIYAVPMFLLQLSYIAFISMDVILVRHFFSDITSGEYSALSLMGRSIFYLTAPVTFVLFPLIAQKHEKKEKIIGTLMLAIGLMSLPLLLLSGIYFLFPEIVRGIFFPAKAYQAITQYLGYFSVLILFYSLSYLLSNFFFSIGKTKVVIFSLIALVIESMYIYFFHNAILQIILGLATIAFLLFLSLLIYYFISVYSEKK